MKKIFSVLLILFSALELSPKKAMANYMNLEVGRVKVNHNYFQLPNKDENKVNLQDDKYSFSHRINAKIDLEKNSFLYLVYAPSETNYNFVSNKSFQFNNTNFSANSNTEVSYKFNSYRLGYFKKFQHEDKLKYWFGGILNVRDAKIKVRQGDVTDSYSNVGLVPLLGAGAEYYLTKNLSILGHIDSLGFTQGYAYDANSEIKYRLKSNSLGVGYRTVGGGVDNDELMNFARFESFYISYGKEF